MASLPVTYPLGPPAVSGTNLTLDLMLREPTRITSYLSDLTLQNFFMDRIFTPIGGVTGGALLYTQTTYNDLYTDRDVQNVAPGAEFPNVSATRPEPLVAKVEKFGGKFEVTDEARDRNDPSVLQMEGLKLSNTITKKIVTRGISALDASVTATGAGATITGNNWGNVITAGTSATNNASYPGADFAKAQLKADQTELGVNFNLWIVNPQEKAQFSIVYGPAAGDILASYGVVMIASNRVAAGTAYVVAEGQVGKMGMEKPLSTETWREADRQVTVVQSDCRPVFAVTNPYSVVKVTGLAG